MKNYTVYPSIFILLLGGTFLLGRKQKHDIENDRFNPQSEPYGQATSFTGVEMHSQDSYMKYSQSVDELMYSKLFTKPLERSADDIPLSKDGKVKVAVKGKGNGARLKDSLN